MGKLVRFEKREKTTKAKPETGDAQILMFTGIRYERGAPGSGKPRPAGSKRNRG